MFFLINMGSKMNNNIYGALIVCISVVTRIFVVSIAWSYGVFLVELRKAYPTSYNSELGWIAGLAQGFGSIISPSYIWMIRKLGYRLTFLIGLTLCFFSMIASSYTTSEHHLFFTYSLPFGIGSSIIFVLESLLAGVYFPRYNKYHVTASVAISAGFPLGYLILSSLTEGLLEYFEHDWKFVQRLYGFFTLFQLILFTPLFTEKYADKTKVAEPETQQVLLWTNVYFIKAKYVKYFTKSFWLVALFLISCGNNSIQINLNGFFTLSGINTQDFNSYLIAIGASDVIFRILLAFSGQKLINNLCYCYITAAIAGVVVSAFWSTDVLIKSNIVLCLIFGICPAVTMSLMYSINPEINGKQTNIDQDYTINVMISGFGIFFGPILTGYILDVTDMKYRNIFIFTTCMYVIASMLFILLKGIILKNEKNNEKLNDYEPFDNDSNF